MVVITEEVKIRIRRLHFAEGWPVGTIAAQLGVHHETVERALQAAMSSRPAQVRPSMLDPYLPFIRATLAQYPRLRSSRLFEMLGARGYRGSAVQVRRLVRRVRPQPAAEAYHRLRTLPGEQGQADWGHFGTVKVGKGTRPLAATRGRKSLILVSQGFIYDPLQVAARPRPMPRLQQGALFTEGLL